MQNQTSLTSFIWQAATLALFFSLVVLVTLLLSAPAIAQSLLPAPYKLSVTHNATGRGVISPGCAALVNLDGGQFVRESQQVIIQPLPYTLAGVSVTIDGQSAPLRLVTPTQLAIIAPNVTFPPKMKRLAWFKVVVTTPTDTFVGWAAFAPTAPGLYEQTTGKTHHVQGGYQASPTIVRAIDGQPMPAGVRVMVLGTGMQKASQVRVWIDDGVDLWIVPASLSMDSRGAPLPGWIGLAWIEGVYFDLPADAKGNLLLIVQADQMWSQEFQLLTF